MATTTVMQNTITMEPFDAKVGKWSRWVDRFENAIGLVENGEGNKVSYLLMYMGGDAYNVLCDKIAPAKAKDQQYKEIVAKLKAYYEPTPNEILENYRFHLRKQKDHENCDEFLVALRRMSTECKFGAHLDTALRNQFVFGMKNERILNRLLEKQDLTLEKALSTAKSMEASERGGAEIYKYKDTNTVNHVKIHTKKKKSYSGKGGGGTNGDAKKSNEVATTTNTNGGRKCFRCGKPDHLANKCTFINANCNFCKQKGHLERVCMKKKQMRSTSIGRSSK